MKISCPKCLYEWTPSRSRIARLLASLKSEKRAAASQENGKLGGAPRKKLCPTCGGCGLEFSDWTSQAPNKRKCRTCRGTGVALLLALTTFMAPWLMNAQPAIDDRQAVRAIIGEASNQGEEGMLAVACAIRNRGTLHGVYGVNARHVDKEPRWVWDRARAAWEASRTRDVVDGADHWENIQAFGTPGWAGAMVHTTTIGDHAFYRSQRAKRREVTE